ncbi:P-loop containing nucleoside triphosphate hydrolase protein, partial [Mycena polygramma]
LPSEPKIFVGRESEVSDILDTLNRETPRIAILGPGGIGKTSLARTILHHPEVHTRYDGRRFFVVCDSASTKVEVAALIAAHLGLKPSKDPTDAIIRHFSDGAPCLLVLDNLDRAWEPLHLRRDVEDFLALLSAVEHLALMITMRGAERPGKVRWTRPFLSPLKPLEHAAAREIFFEIADDVYDDADVDKILALTGNMPLAIDLISHLVSAEGCSNILSRWEMEKTSLVSEGHDRRSNLELSIAVSLSSPRITGVPHALDLLSLLSMLPDGLSDVELLQSKLQMDDILRCKLALLRTSMAYNDDVGRLRCLVPIREYIRNTYPPSPALVHSLLAHFTDLLQLYLRFHGTPENTAIVGRITSNFVNIENLLLHGLQLGA